MQHGSSKARFWSCAAVIVCLAWSARAGDTLSANQALAPGQALVSTDGRTSLSYQGDGNLVVYKDGVPLWASGTAGSWAGATWMQGDGNLVVYDGGGSPLWSSGTWGHAGAVARAVDGDAVVCAGGHRLWTATGAGQCSTGGGGGGGGSISGVFLGCWTDGPARALPASLGSGYDVGRCIDTARQQGYAYAGLQWYGECFAGNHLGDTRAPDGECNTPCGANPAQTCGGAWRNSVYATGARDGDGDALSDDMEASLAQTLMPLVYPHSDEQCSEPLPRPVAFRLRFPRCLNGFVPTDIVAVNYYLLYSRDCGLGSHDGDNEGLVVLGRRVTGSWQREWVSAIAHANTPAEIHSTGTRGWIVSSRNKHANYTSLEACARHITDDCRSWPPDAYYRPLSFHNVGEPNRPLLTVYGQIHSSFWGNIWGGQMMRAGVSHWDLWRFWMPPPPPGCSGWDTGS